jgi:hypothetical protein
MRACARALLVVLETTEEVEAIISNKKSRVVYDILDGGWANHEELKLVAGGS